MTVQRSAPSTGTLLERVGGSDNVRRIVETYVRKLYADEELAVFLQSTDMTSLRAKQSNFLCWLFSPTDQPNTSRHVRTAHLRIIKRGGFTAEHFEAGLTHMEAALREHGLSELLVKEVMGKIRPYKDLAFTPLARDMEDEKRWAIEDHLNRPTSATAASATTTGSRPPSATARSTTALGSRPPSATSRPSTAQSSARSLTATSQPVQHPSSQLQQQPQFSQSSSPPLPPSQQRPQQQSPLLSQQDHQPLTSGDPDLCKSPRSPPLPPTSPSPSTPPMPAQPPPPPQGPQQPQQQQQWRHPQRLLLPQPPEAACGATADAAAAAGRDPSWQPSGPPSPASTITTIASATATTAAATAAASPSSNASFPAASAASESAAIGAPTATRQLLVPGSELATSLSPPPRAHSAIAGDTRSTAGLRLGAGGVGTGGMGPTAPAPLGVGARCPFTGVRLSAPVTSAFELPTGVTEAARASLGVMPPPPPQAARPALRLVSSGPTTPPGGRVGATAGSGSGPASVAAGGGAGPPLGLLPPPPPLAPLSLPALPPLALPPLPPPPPLPSARSSVPSSGQSTPLRRSMGHPVSS